MKTYSKNSSVRKPMMYGGSTSTSPNTFGSSMAMGMQKDKMDKNMDMMMYGGKPSKRSR
tara:strand:- start:498 stop:674 length:177 start_codon:yes stop_codon:yes gene_type:complete